MINFFCNLMLTYRVWIICFINLTCQKISSRGTIFLRISGCQEQSFYGFLGLDTLKYKQSGNNLFTDFRVSRSIFLRISAWHPEIRKKDWVSRSIFLRISGCQEISWHPEIRKKIVPRLLIFWQVKFIKEKIASIWPGNLDRRFSKSECKRMDDFKDKNASFDFQKMPELHYLFLINAPGTLQFTSPKMNALETKLFSVVYSPFWWHLTPFI